MQPSSILPSTQVVATAGPILGMLAGYFAAWWGVDQATALGVLTAGLTLVVSAYSAWATRKTAQVTEVANMPEVKAVVLNKAEVKSSNLEANTPDNVVAQ